jgi:hypothetical protein
MSRRAGITRAFVLATLLAVALMGCAGSMPTSNPGPGAVPDVSAQGTGTSGSTTAIPLIPRATCLELGQNATLQVTFLQAVALAIHSKARQVLDVEHTAQAVGVQLCAPQLGDYAPWSATLAEVGRVVTKEGPNPPENLTPIVPVAGGSAGS